MEQQSKWLMASKTFLGIIITGIGVAASAFGWDWWGAISDDVSTVLNLLLQIVGLVIAVIGRIKAKGPATVLPQG